ncbi:RNA polymerase sigma factor [Pelagicoccus mobilis]|uniref:Sigma-70 family RNA polymerase sigma factor n=1 Tax=Pelagicoccus mobilis TaxID=415221 RepID=A0A934RW87_9BACT|nr:sigma-70 family RNA polymerase sigma factor [Pelagicoccus mobilis]MBK1877631.1 sigma-70 family RNA polymerase sigma factor [Pelagicoccus mobilis]
MPPQPQSISDWFESEVRVNEPSLRAYLKHKVPEGTEVDDILQETYAKIISIQRTKPILSPRGLLFTIAKNLIRDLFRKKYSSKIISLGEIDDSSVFNLEHTAVPEFAQTDEVEILQAAIRSLPKKCRVIFLLRNYERLSYKQIAERLGISVKTVEAQLAIGIKRCRKFFEAKGIINESR